MKQGWKIKKLGEIGELKYGYTEKASLQKNGPKFLRITDIQDDLVDWCLVPYCKCNDFEYEKYKLEINDIVFARTGATTGKSFLIENLEEESVFASYLIRLRIDDKGISPRYLMYFLKTEYYWSIINQGISGSAQGGFNASKLAELHLRYPQIAEQERIVGILDSAFAKIEALRANAQQNLQNTKDLFQASLKQELTPKQGWKSKRLNEICEVKDGTHDSPKYVDDGIPFVTQKNITAKGFDIQDTRKITLSDHEKFYKRSNVEYGDILISMIGANRGMSCLVDVRDTFSIKNVGLVKQRDTIKQRYLLYYLQSPISAKYVADASNGGAQEFIGLTALRAFPILFPKNSEEQQTIVEKLDALSERCRAMEENYRQTITHCNALKQVLLTKAFNGEL